MRRRMFWYSVTNFSKDLCNKNQLDAIFILGLSRQSTPVRFGHVCSPKHTGVD